MKTISLRFVDYIPKDIDAGVLYVSLKYKTMVHLCCCGCKNKVVTPISPAGWNFKYNGETISIRPSIGNWNFPCRSHYWISESQIVWDKIWGKDEIEQVRIDDFQERNKNLKEKSKQSWIKKLLQRIINQFNN